MSYPIIQVKSKVAQAREKDSQARQQLISTTADKLTSQSPFFLSLTYLARCWTWRFAVSSSLTYLLTADWWDVCKIYLAIDEFPSTYNKTNFS